MSIHLVFIKHKSSDMTTTKMNFFRILLSCCFCLGLINLSFSQDIKKDKDFEKRWEKQHNHYHHHWGYSWNNDWDNIRVGLLDLGFSTYLHKGSLNYPAELDQFDLLYGGSLHFNLHLIRHRVKMIGDDLRLEYGLSVSWMSYKFANDFRILEDTIPFSIVDDGTNYKKNKLKTTFLEIPLMFTLVPGKHKSFNMSAGIYGGVLLNAKQKLVEEEGKNKIRVRDDFNLNKFRYGLIGKIGFGPIALYAQLALNDLFKEGQGPELRPFNIGLTILNY